jgi:hypothetical protein
MQKHNPPLTAKSASAGSATTLEVQAITLQRSRRSREFFFGYFLFDGQK